VFAAIAALHLASALLSVTTPGPGGYWDYTPLLHGPQCKPHHRGASSTADWARPRSMTVVTDSVLLGGAPALRARRPCWHVATAGRPFLSVGDATRAMRSRRIAPVAVVGLGYNSSWEKHRARYAFWAAKFDRDALRMVTTLRRRGARQVVWVTVREPTARIVPRSARAELARIWYLRYVNERLRRLDRSRDDVILADWNKASKRPGLTYDALHLNPRGAKLMVSTIRSTIANEARRQARESRRPPS
jgi:hypothetical protein